VQSHRTEKFRKAFDALPESVKDKAREAYNTWRTNPNFPSLAFKQVSGVKDIYSIRIGLNYRALAVKDDSTFIWFWIGSHEDYNKIVNQL
jgi:hypothetical protein